MSRPTTTRTAGRVTQLTPEEARSLRDEARRVVDAHPEAPETRALPASGSLAVRAARAVAGGVRAVAGAVAGAARVVSENREGVILASKAGAAMIARWGYDAAVEAIRAEVRKTVVGAITGKASKAGPPQQG